MGAIAKIKRGAKALVTRHGAEVGVCAKVAVAALMPGGGGLPEVIRALCDYVGQKDADALPDERVLALLGELKDDQAQVATVMERLSEQMSDVMAQMVGMARFNIPEEGLTHIIEVAISTRSEVMAVRQELMGLQADMSVIQAQNEEVLRRQRFAGDMLSQVKDSVNAALGFCAPLLSEGVPADKTHAFLQAHMTFQRCLVRGDLRKAVEAFKELKAISATSDTVKVCEIALRAIKRDFEGAERVAQTLSLSARGDARVGRMTRSVASLTRGARQGERPAVAEAPASQGFRVGQTLGSRSWALKSQLGRGGMGEVWQVENRHQETGALKVMARRLSDDPAFVARFEAEIVALKRVRHRSVVEVLDWGRDSSGAWFLVMELIEGSSLGSRLRRGPLSLSEGRALMIALLKGLAACHEAGVVHRDLKPDNIMLRADGSPVLIDFGIAHQEGSTAGHTQVATVVYAPPEQLRGERVGPEADLYALGQTLAECFGGWRAVPDELIDQLEKLTNSRASRRGSALEWLRELEGSSHSAQVEPQEEAKYHAAEPGGAPEGPFKLSEVVRRVLAGSSELLLWWAGASGWSRWSEVREVKVAVDAARPAPAPTPPPLPTPPPVPRATLKPLDRVEQKVGSVSFFERVIPAPPGGKSFLMMETQVTQALWQEVMGSNPSVRKGHRKPVESVSWEDSVRFANALSRKLGLTPAYSGDDNNTRFVEGANGFRLPLEAEWEFAARGGEGFKFAGSDNLREVGWYGGIINKFFGAGNVKDESTHDVAQLKPNAYGLYDMSGNVWEWCSDDYNNPGQHRPGADERVRRGGGYLNNPNRCVVTYRGSDTPDHRFNSLGLRLSRPAR